MIKRLISISLFIGLGLVMAANWVMAQERGTKDVVIAFDDRHSTSWTIYSRLIEMLRSEEYSIKRISIKRGEAISDSRSAALPKNAFKNIDLFIIGGTQFTYSDSDVDLTLKYVKNGGNLIILVPAPPKSGEGFKLRASESAQKLIKRLDLGVEIKEYSKGRILLVPHPVTRGVNNFYLYTGNYLDITRGKIIGKCKEADISLMVEKDYGKGKIIVSPDFLQARSLSSQGTNGANYKLFINMVEYLVHNKENPKPQGYYTRYTKDIDRKIKDVYYILFVPVDFEKDFTIEQLAKNFQKELLNQLGLKVYLDITEPIKSNTKQFAGQESIKDPGVYSSSSFQHYIYFLEDVIENVKDTHNLGIYDLVVITTSDHGGLRWHSSLGGHYIHTTKYPNNIILLGKYVRFVNAGWNQKKKRWDYDTVIPITEYNLRDMTHILLYKFGRFLNFSEKMSPKPYIMSGFIKDSKLIYSSLFKDFVSFCFLKRAEGLIYMMQKKDYDTFDLQMEFVSGLTHYVNKDYREATIQSRRIIKRLTFATRLITKEDKR